MFSRLSTFLPRALLPSIITTCLRPANRRLELPQTLSWIKQGAYSVSGSHILPTLVITSSRQNECISLWKIFAVTFGLGITTAELTTSHAEEHSNKVKMADLTNLKKVAEILSKAIENIQPAKGKNITLFLGPTGAGKGVLINYLMDVKLIEEIDRFGISQIMAAPGESCYVEIGNDPTRSCTVFPKAVKHSSGKVLCDTAGLFDTRSLDQAAESMVANIAAPLAISIASGIDAVVVVINYQELVVQKGDAFKKTVGVLASTLKNSQSIENSIVWVFTHLSKTLKKEHAHNLITAHAEELKNSLNTSVSSEERVELEKQFQIYQLILKAFKRKDVFLIRGDQKDDIEALKKRLFLATKKELIEKKHFDLSQLMASSLLSQFVESVVTRGLALIEEERLLKIQERKVKDSLESCNLSLAQLSEHIDRISRSQPDFFKLQKELENVAKKIAREKLEKNREITDREKRAVELENKERDLDIQYRQQSSNWIEILDRIFPGYNWSNLRSALSAFENIFFEGDLPNITYDLWSWISYAAAITSIVVSSVIAAPVGVVVGPLVWYFFRPLFFTAGDYHLLKLEQLLNNHDLIKLRDEINQLEELEKQNKKAQEDGLSKNLMGLKSSLEEEQSLLLRQNQEFLQDQGKIKKQLESTRKEILSLKDRVQLVHQFDKIVCFQKSTAEFLKQYEQLVP